MPSTDTPSNSTILASGHFLPRNESETSVPPAPPALPPQLDQTLQSLTSHRSVLGYLLLSRGQPVTLIRHSGVVFEGEHGRKYAQAIGRIVERVQIGLGEVSTDSTGGVRSVPTVSPL